MIDKIIYTVNGNKYELVYTDGKWIRELNAPVIPGTYTLSLEVYEGNNVTYIDSSDSRYDFLLNVIVNYEKYVDISKYVQFFIANNEVFSSIYKAQSTELDYLYMALKKLEDDVNLLTCSPEIIEKIEKFLKVKGEGTIEQRRSYLLAKIQKPNKLNEIEIKKLTKQITGGDCLVSFFAENELDNPSQGNGTIYIQVLSPDSSKDYRYSDVQRVLQELIPGHLKLLVVKYFATWEDIKINFSDWSSVAAMSDWQAVKNYIPPQ